MKALRPIGMILLVLVLLAAPVAARWFWFNQGAYQRSAAVATPGYTSLEAPKMPLSTPQAEAVKLSGAKKVVLFDYEHGNQFTLAELDSFTRFITSTGAKVEVSNFEYLLAERLKRTDTFVVINPTIPFAASDILAIDHFIQRGGRMLVLTDPTRNINNYYYGGGTGTPTLYSTEVANLLLKPYGIGFSDDYVYNTVKNEGNYRNIILEQFSSSPLTAGVAKVIFYGAHSLTVTTDKNALVTGNADTLSSQNDKGGAVPVAASARDNNVLAIGDMSFLTTPYNQVADNPVFIQNIVRFLVEGKRKVDLAEFPFVFSRPLTMLSDTETLIDQDFLVSLSGAQTIFKLQDLPIQLSDKPIDGSDLVVFGTMPKVSKTVEEYLKPFNLKFDKERRPTPTPGGYGGGDYGYETPTPDPEQLFQDVVTIPGFGKFAVEGLGLLLYTPGESRNTLILLAANTQALNIFTYTVLVTGDMSGCLVKDNIAVCRVYTSSGY